MQLLSDLGTAVEIQLTTAAMDLHTIEGGNRSVTMLYLQLHSTSAAVAGMTTCLYALPVPAGTRTDREFAAGGLRFPSGLRAAWSTTEHTFTAYTGAASELGVWAQRRLS